MKVIVDNGGTSSDWAIVSEKKIISFDGINMFDSEKKLFLQFQNIFSSLHLQGQNVSLDFYTAGVTSEVDLKVQNVFNTHFPTIDLCVLSDMLGASRALFMKKKGISCILGTGSNCAYFDGHQNHSITPSLGYLLSDEGSGYDLGRRLLIKYFNDALFNEINQAIYDVTNMNKDDLISFIYSSQNPKKYIASFSILIKQFEHHRHIKNIINESVVSFLHTHPFKHTNYIDLRFGFVGSVAFSFKDYISNILEQQNIESVFLKKPIENLLQYYSK